MAECKACGEWFGTATPQDLCPTCERALNRLGGYVAPVRHGRWIGLEYDGYADGAPVYDLWECSECGEEVRAGTMSLIRTRGAIAAARKWTPMDELLTGKDLDTIARAHRHCREMEIERTLGALRVRVSTCPATRAWSVPYLIRLERWRPGMYSTQYFDSAEALREELKHGTIDLSGR